MAFLNYFTTPTTGQTVYGKTESGGIVAFQTPEQLAQAQGTTTANFSLVKQYDNYDTSTAQLYPDYQKSLTTAPTNTAIPATSLTPQTSVNLSGTIPPPDGTADAMVAGTTAGQKSIEDYLKMLTPTTTSPTEQRYNDILGQVEGMLPGLANKSTDQLSAEQSAGLPQLKTQLADLNSQLLTRSAEYNKLFTEQEGKPITMSSIIGSQAQIQKMQASEIGLLQARALGLQGQIGAAQASVDRAIDLKYSAQQDKINVKLQQLKLIAPILDKEESRQARALELYLNDQQTKIDAQKDADKQLQMIGIEAAAAGAPQSLITQALNTKDPVQASQILNQYLHATGEESGVTGGNALAEGYPFYKYLGSEQVFDSKTNQPINFEQYKTAGGVGTLEGGAFGDVYEVGGTMSDSSELNKLLTPTEAAKLGVPYGTTRGEASNMELSPTTTTSTSSIKYVKTANESGGLTFTADGEPITLSEYLQAKHVSVSTALSGSKDSADTQLLSFINKAVSSGDTNLQNLAADAQTAIYNGATVIEVLDILRQEGAL